MPAIVMRVMKVEQSVEDKFGLTREVNADMPMLQKKMANGKVNGNTLG